MSVILDALQKARGDKRNVQQDPVSNGVARVVDAGAMPQPGVPVSDKHAQAANNRGWIAPVAVIFGVLSLLVLISGAFFLLYDQMRRLESHSATVQMNESVGPHNDRVVNAALHSPAGAVLPPPLPLSDLPVQAPGGQAAGGYAPAPPVTPDFKLGSIVCENNNCLASLNGRSVHVGDEVKGYQVVAINPSDITLKSRTGNDEITLSLFD